MFFIKYQINKKGYIFSIIAILLEYWDDYIMVEHQDKKRKIYFSDILEFKNLNRSA